jgi:hypothetical protein
MFILNAFASVQNISNIKTKVQLYAIKNLPQIDEKHRLLAELAEELESKYHITFLTYSPEKAADFLIAVKEDFVHKTLPHERYIINYHKQGYISNYHEPLRSLIYKLSREKLESYRLWRHTYNKYYELIPEKVIEHLYELYRGIFFRFEFVGDKVLLILDPLSRIVSSETIKEFISRIGVQSAKEFFQISENQLGRHIIVTLVRKRSQSRAIKRVVRLREEKANESVILIDGKSYSIKSYYREYLGLPKIADTIDDNDLVLEVDEGIRSGFYASSFSNLVLRTDEISVMDRQKLRPEIFLSAENRLRLTRKFLGMLSRIEHPELGQIEFEKEPMSLNPPAAGVIGSPMLSFHLGKEQVNYSEYSSFFKEKLKNWGPVVRKAFPPRKQLVIVHPQFVSEAAVRSFYRDIVKISQRYFRVILPYRPRLWKYPDINIDDHYARFRVTLGAAIFVVKDEYDAENFYRFKRLFQDLPNQAITYGLINLKWTAKNGRERSLYWNAMLNVASGLLGKMGTRPWLLENDLSSDVYVGIDVGGIKAKVLCVTVMDKKGNYLFELWRSLSGVKPSQKDVAQFVGIILNKLQNISSITFHRDGEFFDEEINGVSEEISDLTTIEKAPIPVFVSVKKNVPYRIYGKENEFMETPIGAFSILSENMGLLATTGKPLLKQGMAKPLLVEIHPKSPKNNIQDVLRDIYDLSFMHWGSLVSKTKLPATIKYADDLAGYAEHGIRTVTPPL